ncbi:tetratricopeptide repeat protein [Sphingobacterium corticibacter]|uniref:Tetratricopeptide repeat protein n=1 Tax=Sphingobacterium corticibacter TaxID=2171749 RepID=A0A2T8HFM0_9SPHI|nr:hypothetical protein [Sphingobacterium corticibacter]PVH24162.1 hypothetical protein DC487_15620 [Sphingobacterium corticibacter]
MKHIQKIFVTVGSLCVLCGTTQAQSAKPTVESTPKYNPTFDGIGPKVYFLPPPRTENEVLIDDYAEKRVFHDSIARAMQFQDLLTEFRFTSKRHLVQQYYQQLPATSEEWNKAINQETSLGNTAFAAALMNEYAWLSLNKHFLPQTVGLLIGAVDLESGNVLEDDFTALQRNLADVYLYNRNYREAAALQERLLAKLDRHSSIVEQAHAYTRMALVQAYLKDYKLAENSIIRKAIPLYNRAKDRQSKVLAWQLLASIYQMHDKHTEAQWFLIQARDLAAASNFRRELGTIEYMLASSKLEQKNYKVALLEFARAEELAVEEKDPLLQLAIHDKKGEAHLALSQFKEAKEELTQYWKLREQLF